MHMHGLMAVPGSRFVSSWAWYTRLCTLVVPFGAVSGVYLFASRAERRALGYGAAVVAALASAAMMAWAVTGG
jgi:hypothetical protein